jgi:hypothetical protein
VLIGETGIYFTANCMASAWSSRLIMAFSLSLSHKFNPKVAPVVPCCDVDLDVKGNFQLKLTGMWTIGGRLVPRAVL